MSQDQLRGAFESIKTQIQSELDAQLAALERQHGEALESARQSARSEADEHWTSELKRAQAEWDARLQSELADARADAERQALAESSRVRVQVEEQTRRDAETAVAQVRAELQTAHSEFERTLAEERSRHSAAQSAQSDRVARLEADLEDAGRQLQILQTELADLRAQREREGAEARESLEAESLQVRNLNAELENARRALEEMRQAFDAEREETRNAFDAERENTRKAFDVEMEATRRAIEVERKDARATYEAEREETRKALEAEKEKTRDARLAHEQEAADARAAERQSQLAVTERLLRSVQAISRARSLSDVLAALTTVAAVEASRAAVLIPRDEALHAVTASGFDMAKTRHQLKGDEADPLQMAIRERQAVPVTSANAPAFAALTETRAGLAVPIVVGGLPVAVLYADNNVAGAPEVPASWPEAVQILCDHASTALAHLTAVRTSQAMRLMRPTTSQPPAAAQSRQVVSEDDQAARRYARLLVSEIKLYNESAVRIGREKRDLLVRLRTEVERARRLYEERVPLTVADRARYFEQELIQILADGDASLLGNPVVAP